MSKPLIDPATAARIRADMQAARDALISDRANAFESAIESILKALEAAKS
jgi:hypothetical protein